MTSRQTDNLSEPGLSEQEIIDYLRTHPEFFENHAELLAELKLRHPAGHAISLMERQVMLLREQKDEAQQKLNNLIEIARENDSLNKRMQRITLALMEASSLDDVLSTLRATLREDFKADSVIINLFLTPGGAPDFDNVDFVDRDDEALEIFKKFFESRKPICGRLNKAQSEYLFGETASEIGSAALLPICDNHCFGMLAIGSRDPKRFHPAMGTLFLTYMGEAVGRALRPYLAELEV